MSEIVTPETTLARAHLIMKLEGTTTLPVLEDGRVIGSLTEGDIQKAIKLRRSSKHIPLIVGNFMTSVRSPNALSERTVNEIRKET